jgi:HPt (histidine-containing phosphotransfer) domain-containing protein
MIMERHIENDIFNRNEALFRVDGDMELLRELAGLFLENCPAQLAGIQVAIAQNDSRSLERAAHDIKSSVGVFCAKLAFEAALKLEIMGRKNDLAGVKEVYTTLEKEIGRLKPELEVIMSEQ